MLEHWRTLQEGWVTLAPFIISQKWQLEQTQVYDKPEVLRPVYFLTQQNLWALFFACRAKFTVSSVNVPKFAILTAKLEL